VDILTQNSGCEFWILAAVSNSDPPGSPMTPNFGFWLRIPGSGPPGSPMTPNSGFRLRIPDSAKVKGQFTSNQISITTGAGTATFFKNICGAMCEQGFRSFLNRVQYVNNYFSVRIIFNAFNDLIVCNRSFLL